MNLRKNILNWFIDAIALVGFILVFFLDLTGVDLHQWLGLILGGLALVHLVLHWGWVKNVTAKYFGALSWRSRLYALIDSFILLGFGVILATGLVISTWLNLSLTNYQNWRDVHVGASIGTLLLLVVKIGLHWRWIISTAQHIFLAPASYPQLAPRSTAVQPAAAQIDRRQFLTLMSVVGAAASLAIGGVVLDDQNTSDTSPALASETIQNGLPSSGPSVPQASVPASSSSPQLPTSEPTQAATVTPSTPAVASSSNVTASEQCFVRCNRGCSYPGRCRRYTDSNGNSKCDLGECA
jgi:hypothetical protein